MDCRIVLEFVSLLFIFLLCSNDPRLDLCEIVARRAPGIHTMASIKPAEVLCSRWISPADASAGEKQVYDFTAFDRGMRFALYQKRLLFFASDGGDFAAVVAALEESLRWILLPFHPLCGRTVMRDGRLRIDCSGEMSARFSEAVAEARIADVGDFEPSQFCDSLCDMGCQPRFPWGAEIPLLFVQVTSFACGGMSVGIGFSHQVMDGVSAWQFLNAWAERARSAGSSPLPRIAGYYSYVPPALTDEQISQLAHRVGISVFWERLQEDPAPQGQDVAPQEQEKVTKQDLAPQEQDKETKQDLAPQEQEKEDLAPQEQENGIKQDIHSREQEKGIKEEDLAPQVQEKVIKQDLTKLGVKHFTADRAELQRLKSLASSSSSLLAPGKSFTSFESLCASYWHRMVAASVRAHHLDPDRDDCFFMVLLNCRGRIKSIPTSYFGNAVCTTLIRASVREVAAGDLSRLAQLIHDAIARIDEETAEGSALVVEKLTDVLEKRAGNWTAVKPVQFVLVVSSPHHPVFQCDFGFGRPVGVSFGTNDLSDSKLYLFPAAGDKGGVDVTVCAREDVLEKM